MSALSFITEVQLISAFLIFARLGGLIFSLPIYGDAPTPIQVRILVALALTFVFVPIVAPINSFKPDTTLIEIAFMIIKELAIGLIYGFIARLIFDAILMAANLVGFQMGFGTAHLFVPDADQALNGFTAVHRVLVWLMFFGLNLHHLFMFGISSTFEMIPLGSFVLNPELGQHLIDLTAQVFVVAMQLAAPILVALLFTMAALGLAARTVPQLNVFVLSFPLSFFIGLLVYIATLPLFPSWLEAHYTEFASDMQNTLAALTSKP